ncbi:MAG: hypothetical protein ABFD46_05415 [Armatimonadota bacterium]
MLLNKFAEYLKSQPDNSFQVVVQSDVDEDRALPSAEPVVAEQAEIAEGTGMLAHPIQQTKNTRFTHFLDGAQATRRIGFHNHTVPLLYAHLGAVIRRRNADRRMSTSYQAFSENLYFSFDHLDPAEMLKSGIEAKNVKIDGDGDTHPLRLLELARRSASNDRAELERKLADEWMKNSADDEWLLWDGSITGRMDAAKHPRVVGVIKSHQTQYFNAEDQRKILSLGVGERSSVFKPRGRDWVPVYSWYLRLHSNVGRDVYFGLVRVEAAASKNTIAIADEISGWLMRERSPLALPDSRWDRMIYPIRDCEQYIKSIAPSKTMIDSALAGMI